LVFRADDPPSLDAVEIARIDSAAGNCRALSALIPAGPRLWLLGRTRPGGPWRLLPNGPLAPGDPTLVSERLDGPRPTLAPVGATPTCVAGFAPPGTAAVRYVPPVGPARDLLIRTTPDGRVVFLGAVQRNALEVAGPLRAYDARGRARVLP
jgi:hypothetical protein